MLLSACFLRAGKTRKRTPRRVNRRVPVVGIVVPRKRFRPAADDALMALDRATPPRRARRLAFLRIVAAHAASYTYNNSGTNCSQVKPRLRREGERERERERERENGDVENVFDFSDAILSRRRREYLYRFLRSIRAIRRSTTRGDEEEEGGTMPRQKTRGRLLRFPRGPSLL